MFSTSLPLMLLGLPLLVLVSSSACWCGDTVEMGSILPMVSFISVPEVLTNEPGAVMVFDCDTRVCTTECSLDASAWIDCESPFVLQGLEDGEHSFAVRGLNERNQPGEVIAWTWTVDTKLPLVVEMTGPPELTALTTATLHFECSKEQCDFECIYDGSDLSACESGMTVESSSDGPHELGVSATDPAANVGPTSWWRWTLDSTAPEVTELAGPPDPTNATTTELRFGCSKEDCSFICALEGAAQGLVSMPAACDGLFHVFDLADDTYTFSVRATDRLGKRVPLSTGPGESTRFCR